MDNASVTIFVRDLEISNKCKRFLAQAGIVTLDDLLNRDMEGYAASRGVRYDVLRELNEIMTHADEIVSYYENRARLLNDIFPDAQNIPIEKIGLSPRSFNALKRGGIHTVGALFQMSSDSLISLRNIGAKTRDQIVAITDAISKDGKSYFDKLKSAESKNPEVDSAMLPAEKGFDFAVIHVLMDKFAFKPARMSEWFGLSRQSIYNTLEKRPPLHRSVWTGKELSEKERIILNDLIDNNAFDFTDGEVTCCCMNNRQDDFVCLFIYEDEIKCFFLRDLPDEIRERIIEKKMHIYTERELTGESDGDIVTVFQKPFYRPNDPERFNANAQLRGMTPDEYAVFISGYPHLNQRSITDDQIVDFLKRNMVDGKVYISSDPKNQWLRSIASRNGFTIKALIELYGFEPRFDGSELTTDGARERHCEELRRCIVHDNVVYLPTDSRAYRVLHTYAYNLGIDMTSYIRSLGFERTTERPASAVDTLERDMEVRQSDGNFEEKIFAHYPLLGSKILKPETVDRLNEYARKSIDHMLREPQSRLTLHAEMLITLALINNAKGWKSEENGNFWNYITLQFGYRDAGGAVVHLLQTALEHAMKRNQRLFLEDANGRAFKSTVVIHALTTKKSWMALFDFLFDFYKSNLNWRVIPGDPLIPVMVHTLRQKLSGDDGNEAELTISAKVYSFQEGIRKLVLCRPIYTCQLFERLIGKIDALVNSNVTRPKTYEEQLCEEWFKEKITTIVNTRKSERQMQSVQRDVAIDYSRIRVKYVLKNETDVRLVLPDIRLKNENIRKAMLFVTCDGTDVFSQSLSWYGNELGKTLNEASVSIPFIPHESDKINLQIQIVCDEETIFNSEDTLNRSALIFYGGAEIPASQIKRDRYTLIVPAASQVEAEKADVIEIPPLMNAGMKGYFLELEDGYVITVNGHLLAFDNENSTEIRVLAPRESAELPSVTLRDTEACLAYRGSACTILLGNSDCLRKYILMKDESRIEFQALQHSENGLAFSVPLDEGKDSLRLQVVSLADERLIFDKTFLLIDDARCCFNREFYFSAENYIDAQFLVDIDDLHEVVPFTKEDSEITLPFRDGELHALIPKVEVRETSGAWLQEARPAWYIGDIPQTSLFQVSAPGRTTVRFLVGGKDVQYDGEGLVTVGNILHSLDSESGLTEADIVMAVSGPARRESYKLARIFLKERFLNPPSFRFDNRRLFWDRGGAFIGSAGRQFALKLLSSEGNEYLFAMDEDTEYLPIPDDMPIGNYRYEISVQTGKLFKSVREVIAVGDCMIGDKNLLRFMGKRIVIDSITDMFHEDTGHIPIRTCYIDRINFCGLEETSEGYCPVYNGILYTTGYHGERYEFSFDAHTNKKGVVKMMVNPVRIVYISDTALCITDIEGDGLYYYSYYDRNVDSDVYALTDREYTKANRNRYSNADLYSYRTERI